jgi:oligopeptide transport system permease protein
MDNSQINLKMFRHVELDTEKSEAVVRPSVTYWQDAWRRLKNNKVAITCMFFLIFIVLMCIFVPILSTHSYTEQLTSRTNEGPSWDHLFGLDDLGRDIFTRLWMGGRVSLLIGLVGTLVSLLVGAVYGGISGYLGGIVDDAMMRIVEVLVGIPYLIVVMIVSMILGKGMNSLIIALCITSWTDLARIVRGQVLSLKESEYVLAAKTLGVSPIKIILKHLLPNTLSVIIVNTTFSIPGFIFAEAFLSFVGMGIQPPNTSWGAMAALGQQQMSYYPHELIFPALAISLTMLAFNLLGDGLRDALDPKLRQ